MKRLSPLPCLVCMLLAEAAFPTAQANAAFVVEAHGSGKANATNFAIIPGAGNATGATASITSNAVGTTATNAIFASNNTVAGVLDTYQFSYTPGTDADNTVFAAGAVLGSKSGLPGDGNRATGLTGGSTELYNVYFTTPASINVNVAGSNFTITQDEAPIVLPLVNLNSAGTGPDTDPGGGFVGGANSAWKLLGTVHLTAGTTYTVTQTSNADSFVSQRAHGVMWERWELTPEPSLGIYTWEYIDPNDPSLGKRQSTTLAPDGAGVSAVPGADLSNHNLTMAFLNFTNLTNANLSQANLTNADFSSAIITGADFTDADFSGANVRGAYLSATNFTAAQLASTASYQAHDLSGIQLSYNNLSRANLSGQNLANANLQSATLSRANLSQANLTSADLTGANLTGANLSEADLTDTIVRNAKLGSTHITLDQLYSTASYDNHDLTGVHFVGDDLSGANFVGQTLVSTSFYAAKLVGADLTNANLTNAELVNADLSQANFTNANFTNATLALANLSQADLRNANFTGANLTSTNLMGADVRGARLGGATTLVYGLVCGRPSVGGCLYYHYGVVSTQIGGGINLAQLSTTASYQAHDLSGIDLASTNLAGANFAGFNLTNANFFGTTLTGADVSGADARGTSDLNLAGAVVTNLIRPDGQVDGLDLGAGQSLSIRDYDGSDTSPIIPIMVDQHFAMGAGGTLRMVFEGDAWDSTISFAAGIPVTLAGALELGFVNGVDLASQVSRTFDLFNWTGVTPNGTFAINSPYAWDLSSLYTTGEITLLSVSGSGGIATHSPTIPEPTTCFLLTVGLVAASLIRRAPRVYVLLPLFAQLVIPCSQSLADPPSIQLTKIGAPIWKPVDFQLFSAPATPFDAEFGQVYNTLLPYDTPIASSYTPHAPPYDTELSTGALAGGYVSQSVFTSKAITLDPNGVYFAFMLVPDPGIAGSSRDFASGPVIPNSLFPLVSNIDAWLDGVLVDKLPGVDAIIPVQPKDVAFQGTSHLESIQAIWHPWDDDLTVGPLGNYDLRASIRDVGGSGWDVRVPFQVVPGIAGDYNGNDMVDAADYTVWRDAMTAVATNLLNDPTPGTVDESDFAYWRAHFGETLGSGAGAGTAAAVPEPATLTMLLMGTLVVLSYRSRQSDAWLARRCGSMTTIGHTYLDGAAIRDA